ncbi:MAG: hypothetical protein LBB45_00250, partial [Methanobrevibacter sp.]|nr:hypothetical protein [Candidatus Methanovirga basalitermitum]
MENENNENENVNVSESDNQVKLPPLVSSGNSTSIEKYQETQIIENTVLELFNKVESDFEKGELTVSDILESEIFLNLCKLLSSLPVKKKQESNVKTKYIAFTNFLKDKIEMVKKINLKSYFEKYQDMINDYCEHYQEGDPKIQDTSDNYQEVSLFGMNNLSAMISEFSNFSVIEKKTYRTALAELRKKIRNKTNKGTDYRIYFNNRGDLKKLYETITETHYIKVLRELYEKIKTAYKSNIEAKEQIELYEEYKNSLINNIPTTALASSSSVLNQTEENKNVVPQQFNQQNNQKNLEEIQKVETIIEELKTQIPPEQINEQINEQTNEQIEKTEEEQQPQISPE